MDLVGEQLAHVARRGLRAADRRPTPATTTGRSRAPIDPRRTRGRGPPTLVRRSGTRSTPCRRRPVEVEDHRVRQHDRRTLPTESALRGPRRRRRASGRRRRRRRAGRPRRASAAVCGPIATTIGGAASPSTSAHDRACDPLVKTTASACEQRQLLACRRHAPGATRGCRSAAPATPSPRARRRASARRPVPAGRRRGRGRPANSSTRPAALLRRGTRSTRGRWRAVVGPTAATVPPTAANGSSGRAARRLR